MKICETFSCVFSLCIDNEKNNFLNSESDKVKNLLFLEIWYPDGTIKPPSKHQESVICYNLSVKIAVKAI